MVHTFACGTCLGASLVWIAVCAVADDSPIRDGTGQAAEGVYSFAFLMYILFVNVFSAVEELCEQFETANGRHCVAFYG